MNSIIKVFIKILSQDAAVLSLLSAETESLQQEKLSQTNSPRMLNTILTLIGQTDGPEETG